MDYLRNDVAKKDHFHPSNPQQYLATSDLQSLSTFLDINSENAFSIFGLHNSFSSSSSTNSTRPLVKVLTGSITAFEVEHCKLVTSGQDLRFEILNLIQKNYKII
ncbi:hypothetical protein BpHYR1_032440 [Brachionus plicatilis]|uniref:Uncharacterized protein n=1 Tax=Brachionus plicatilis TaxID=10195 RepID=A0A3M7PLR3_BRAPC|nr:hypothetical protein BpHYR1_032440 [Brachionus plicatilis]